MRRKWNILWLSMVLVFNASACGRNQEKQSGLETIEAGVQEEEQNQKVYGDVEQAKIYVNVCGAVVSPGVYELQEGSRVYEVIRMAGGFTENAATAQVNQAEVLCDEGYLYVPTVEEVASGEVAGISGQKDGKVNLNRASKEELMTLPGIGEAKAAQIIAHREENGQFQQIEDVMNISGIKEGLFAKIKDYITV